MDWTRVSRKGQPNDPMVTLEEAYTHLRVASGSEDAYLTSLIEAATAFIEGPTGAGVAVLPAQWQLSLDGLPRCIDIDLCPVQTIDSITVDGVEVPEESYDYDVDSIPARIVGSYAPRAYIGPGKVKVLFTAGFATIPADLKAAALLIIGHLYENREGAIAGGTSMEVKEVPLGIRSIIDRYRAY